MDQTTQQAFKGGELLAGKYRIERVIGEGGMGVVLAARHEQLNTNVAIKLLRTIALGHTDVVGRFMREARAAVSLRSEHVARVFDIGNLEDGRPYIVMERLEGKDLGDVIETGPILGIGEAVDYVMQACEAIAEAHATGIVHRDLKPRNLFLTQRVDGRPLVKVLDFGISKMEPQAGASEMQLTKTAEIIGTPSYMSPEQLRSTRNVDGRTDVWALGVILYELLTKRVPFYAETMTELVIAVVTEREVPIRSIRPDCPEAIEAIVARCLQKQPEHRFQSIVELVQALEPYAQYVSASASDRIRNVAASRGQAVPGSGRLPGPATVPVAPISSSSGLPASGGTGGTSVAWGETQSVDGAPAHAPLPPPPARSNLGVVLGGLALGLVLVGAGVGGTLYMMKRPVPPASPPTVAGEGSVALPLGRKDLPPIAPSASVETALPAMSAEAPAPPAASTLPATRKPPPPPSPVKPAGPAPKPSAAPPKSDDLSNIGRH